MSRSAKLRKTKKLSKSAEEIQDEIFRKMPIESKIKRVFEFFELGKKLMALDGRRLYGSHSRKNPPHNR